MSDKTARQILEDILDEWSKDSVISKTSPEESLRGVGELHAKYLRYHAFHKLNSKKVDTEYKHMKRVRLSYYDGSITKETLDKYKWEPYLGPTKKSKTQRESLIEHDEIMLDILEKKAIYDQIVVACEYILKELNSRTYEIRGYMDWEKMIRGA